MTLITSKYKLSTSSFANFNKLQKNMSLFKKDLIEKGLPSISQKLTCYSLYYPFFDLLKIIQYLDSLLIKLITQV